VSRTRFLNIRVSIRVAKRIKLNGRQMGVNDVPSEPFFPLFLEGLVKNIE